jgi:hypothetical protein
MARDAAASGKPEDAKGRKPKKSGPFKKPRQTQIFVILAH